MVTIGRTQTYPAGRLVAAQALQIALGYASAKVREEGGNNRGDQVEFFQRLLGNAPGDPWCADFVSTCLVKAFAREAGRPEDRAALIGYVPEFCSHYLSLSGYCPTLWEAGRERALTQPKDAKALPGDLVFFDWKGAGEPHHVGLVRSAYANGSLQTVEGNTSSAVTSGLSGGDAVGDGVFLRIRPRVHVFGFLRLGS